VVVVIQPLEALYKALPKCMVGSRQAEHKSQGESIEDNDMVISRAIPQVQKRNELIGEEGGCKPKEL
jgi:hypothetical protein